MSKRQYKNRKITREQLMQLLFQMEVQKNFSHLEKDLYINTYLNDNAEIEYFEKVYKETTENKDVIDMQIKKYSKNWAFERISKVDLSIMRLALAEILYTADVPDSVSINEAVELAKKFGGKHSGKFINGILGEITRNKDSRNDDADDKDNDNGNNKEQNNKRL